MFSTEAFEILGLDPQSATDADIKKAYSRKLKVTRPEDDRDGFMKLREAFTAARNHVRFTEQDNAAAEVEAPQIQQVSVADLVTSTHQWIRQGCPSPQQFFEAHRNNKLTDAIRNQYRGAVLAIIFEAVEQARAFGNLSGQADTDVCEATPVWWSDDIATALHNTLDLRTFEASTPTEQQHLDLFHQLIAQRPIAAAPAPQETAASATEATTSPSVVEDSEENWEEDWEEDDLWHPQPLPPVTTAMRDLKSALKEEDPTAVVSVWEEVLNRDNLQPLEELFQLDEQVRQLICNETGLYAPPDQPDLPPWLNEDMVILLDGHFGWSRHFGHQFYERREYEWLHQIIATYKPLDRSEQSFTISFASATAPSGSERLVLWLLKPLNLLLAYLGYRLVQTVLRMI